MTTKLKENIESSNIFIFFKMNISNMINNAKDIYWSCQFPTVSKKYINQI
jgi:hypothetical protein